MDPNTSALEDGNDGDWATAAHNLALVRETLGSLAEGRDVCGGTTANWAPG
jgi:hypothetical protein